MKARVLLGTAMAAGASVTLACSCFGPQTFCETLDPPFPDPEWWIPDAVVLGVKLGDFQHGIDVKIISSFSGTLQPDDTIRVWGDCGLLCRHSPGTWNVGDTVIWGFQITDLAGNMLCGTSYEQPTDHMISICGVYYLDYANGIVSGPITTTAIESMPISQFGQLVDGCLSTDINEQVDGDALGVRYDGGVPVIELPGLAASVDLNVFDALGRPILRRSWNGGPLRLGSPVNAPLLIEVRNGSDRRTWKVVVHDH